MHPMDMQSAVIARLPVPDELESFKVVKNLVTSALLECCSIVEFEALKETPVIERVTEQAHADLQAFAMKDPAAGRDLVFIAKTYTSYSAVLHYQPPHHDRRSFRNHQFARVISCSSRFALLFNFASLSSTATSADSLLVVI